MTCPICHRTTDKAFRPFCSKRCADIDLGKWLTGSYAIASDDPDDAEQLEVELREAGERRPH